MQTKSKRLYFLYYTPRGFCFYFFVWHIWWSFTCNHNRPRRADEIRLTIFVPKFNPHSLHIVWKIRHVGYRAERVQNCFVQILKASILIGYSSNSLSFSPSPSSNYTTATHTLPHYVTTPLWLLSQLSGELVQPCLLLFFTLPSFLSLFLLSVLSFDRFFINHSCVYRPLPSFLC